MCRTGEEMGERWRLKRYMVQVLAHFFGNSWQLWKDMAWCELNNWKWKQIDLLWDILSIWNEICSGTSFVQILHSVKRSPTCIPPLLQQWQWLENFATFSPSRFIRRPALPQPHTAATVPWMQLKENSTWNAKLHFSLSFYCLAGQYFPALCLKLETSTKKLSQKFTHCAKFKASEERILRVALTS